MIFFIAVIAFLILHYVSFLMIIINGLCRVKKQRPNNTSEPIVSVIIPFRNESDTILKSVESILMQSYPDQKLDIIYVNDNSDDDSLEKIEAMQLPEYIRVLTVPPDNESRGHKKRAIRFGVSFAKGEIVIGTDADCTHHQDWIKTMVSYFDESTGFVSGPVAFNNDTSFFKRIQRMEFAGLVLSGAGLIGSRQPVICNAANMGYRHEAYKAAGGFADMMKVSSGDDEYLMKKIHNDTEFTVKYCLDKRAMTYTDANETVEQFYQQRKRWASKSFYYKDGFMLLKLALVFLFYILLAVQPILAIFVNNVFWLTAGAGFLFKLIFEFAMLSHGKGVLFDKFDFPAFVFAQVLHLPYVLISVISGAMGNFVWKDRKVAR